MLNSKMGANNGINSDFEMLAHFKTGYPRRLKIPAMRQTSILIRRQLRYLYVICNICIMPYPAVYLKGKFLGSIVK